MYLAELAENNFKVLIIDKRNHIVEIYLILLIITMKNYKYGPHLLHCRSDPKH